MDTLGKIIDNPEVQSLYIRISKTKEANDPARVALCVWRFKADTSESFFRDDHTEWRDVSAEAHDYITTGVRNDEDDLDFLN